MKRNTTLRLTAEQLESRVLLTSSPLPAVSFTASTFEFPGGFEATVRGGELTDLNNDSTGTVRLDQQDYVVIREGRSVEFWIHDGEGHTRSARERFTTQPTQLVLGDLNNDGYDDFLVNTGRQVEVLLNQGADVANDRAWNGVEKLDGLAANPTSMQLINVTGDETLDLVMTVGTNLRVHPGNGDGTFGDSISYPIGPGIHSVAAHDINGDGSRDIVVGTQTEGTRMGRAAVFLNDGEGTFEAGQEIDDAGPVRTMALTDLNADGSPDLVIGTWESRELDHGGENIHIWNGNGDGTFAAERANYETAGSPLDLAISDLNSDGIEDLIVGHDSTFHHPITNNGPGGVSVLLGAGEGQLHPAVRISIPGGVNVAAADSQIASFQQYGNTVRHFDWNHELTVAARDIAEPVDNLYTRRTSTSGDFNGDGMLDAAVAQAFSDTREITIHLRQPDGDYATSTVTLPRSYQVSELHSGDLNGDGLDDLAITGRTGNSPQAAGLLSNGDGTFSEPVTSRLPNSFFVRQIVDINGDGRDDWLATNSARLSILQSSPDGTNENVTLARISEGSFFSAEVAGRNEDGSANLLAVSSNGVHSLIADGEGGYTESFVAASSHFSTYGDFNGDGQLDFAYGLYGNPQLRMIFGSASGELGRPVVIASRERVESLATARGNGTDKLVLINQNEVELFSRTGDSPTNEPVFESLSVPTGEMMGSVSYHNFLGDESLDLVMVQGANLFSSSPSTQILISEAMPDGTFGQARSVAVPLIDGQVLSTESVNGRTRFMLAHRYGIATTEIGSGEQGEQGDFNSDGRIDANDIDLMCAALRHDDPGAEEPGHFDLDNDSDLDNDDVDAWIHDIAQTRRGDINLDGKVDFEDFLDFSGANNFGTGPFGPGGWSQGDFNCDGEVSFGDFLALAGNFGFGVE